MGGFRLRCADCHGIDARGVRGPDITQVWATGPHRRRPVQDHPPRRAQHRDAGVRGAAHLRSRRSGRCWPTCGRWPRPRRRSAARQRRERREDLPHQVRGCHRSTAPAAASGPICRASARRAARRAGGAHPPRLEDSRRLRAGDRHAGRRPPIQGVKKNEDLFSVQIMDTRERIQGYEKDKVKAVRTAAHRRCRCSAPIASATAISTICCPLPADARGFDPTVKQ